MLKDLLIELRKEYSYTQITPESFIYHDELIRDIETQLEASIREKPLDTSWRIEIGFESKYSIYFKTEKNFIKYLKNLKYPEGFTYESIFHFSTYFISSIWITLVIDSEFRKELSNVNY